MRDFEFIHATEDIHQSLNLALNLGRIIRDDSPTENQEPKIISAGDIHSLKSGSFILYKSEWVFSDPVYGQIESGFHQGKFFQHPTTNYSGVNIYFSGERKDGGDLRLGSGFLSWDIDWYCPSDHAVHPAPPDVQIV